MKVEDLNSASLLYSQLYGNLSNSANASDFEESLKAAKEKVDSLGEGLNHGINSIDEMLNETSEVEKFKQDLTKMGAVAFMNSLNNTKIEAKIAAKKAELEKALGLDSKGIVGKSDSEIKALKQTLSDQLEAYKKQLLSEIQNNAIAEKQQKLANSGSSNLTLGAVLSSF